MHYLVRAGVFLWVISFLFLEHMQTFSWPETASWMKRRELFIYDSCENVRTCALERGWEKSSGMDCIHAALTRFLYFTKV